MDKKTFLNLVDTMGILNDRMKKNKTKLEKGKADIKKYADAFGTVTTDDSLVIEGTTHKATITTKDSFDINPEKVFEIVGKDMKKFMSLVKVSMSELEKEIGKNKVEEIKEKTGESKSLTFKKKD